MIDPGIPGEGLDHLLGLLSLLLCGDGRTPDHVEDGADSGPRGGRFTFWEDVTGIGERGERGEREDGEKEPRQ